MLKAQRKEKSLSGKIFHSVSLFTIAVIVVFAIVMSAIYYNTYERGAEQNLVGQAQDAAVSLNQTPSSANEKALLEQFSDEIRYTLIASDGTVLFDSLGIEHELENHADRPEVKEAEASGKATSVRHSDTLQTDTVYAAVKLDDGSIVRLSETRHSIFAFLSELIVPVVMALLIAVVLVFILSKVLTDRIMRPINALDFSKPLDNEIYEEMDPLLKRFDEQQTLLRQQNKELAQAESLRRDFSSNVSHEMKTPLQVISGYAELMKNNMVAPEDRQKFAELIYDEAQAMRLLIDDILILSRLDEAAMTEDDLQSVNLYELAVQASERLASFAASHEVDIGVQGEATYLMGNQTLAEEMIYNLIENGIRYNHLGGRVIVTTEQTEEGIMVKVADTGPGIPKEMEDKIFERFFRIDKSRSKETGGTGLGLAIVKHAVMYHGGTIEIQSTVGKGTTFILQFPYPKNK